MKVAIIPARAGSKRIKDKNIKDFCGKPIIAYAINTALESRIFDKIVVSTDSPKIKAIAESYGASVPHLREKFADDYSTTLEVINYEITQLGLQNDDIVCCIYPTTPLLKAESLILGLKKLQKGRYCFSVCEYRANPLRGFYYDKDDFGDENSRNDTKSGRLKMLRDDLQNARSQDLPSVYYDAGQFYFGYAETFLSNKSIFSEDSAIITILDDFVVDINTMQDWENAELKYKILCKQ